MKNKDINLIQLEAIAVALGELLPHVTFVGGSTTVLLVDEAAHYGVRKTDDVDVIVDVATQVEFHKFSEKLRDLGFREDRDGHICRWIYDAQVGRVKLDVMPVDEAILGFSNQWYRGAIEESMTVHLPGGSEIQVVSPVYFLATKFEAFAGRGEGNYFSHDLEDIVFVLENRGRFIFELMDSSDELKEYFSQQASALLVDEFLNVLPGLLNNPDSTEAVISILKTMASWA